MLSYHDIGQHVPALDGERSRETCVKINEVEVAKFVSFFFCREVSLLSVCLCACVPMLQSDHRPGLTEPMSADGVSTSYHSSSGLAEADNGMYNLRFSST